MRITILPHNKQLLQLTNGDVGLIPSNYDELEVTTKPTYVRFNDALQGLPNDVRVRFELLPSLVRQGIYLIGAYVEDDSVTAVVSSMISNTILDTRLPLLLIIAEEKHQLRPLKGRNISNGMIRLDPVADITLSPPAKPKKKKK